MWIWLASVAFACSDDDRIDLLAVTQELNDDLGARSSPDAAARAAGVLARVLEVQKDLHCATDYADPSRLVGLYTVGARAAERVGDTAARDAMTKQIFVLSPEEPAPEVLRLEVAGVGDAQELPPMSSWAKVRAVTYLRVDGVPVRPGDRWFLPPGRHLVQWEEETEIEGRKVRGVVGEVREFQAGELVRYDRGVVARRADPRPVFTGVGIGLAAAGAATLGVSAWLIHDRATGDGITEDFTNQLNGVLVGGAVTTGVGLGLVAVPIVMRWTF